MDYKEEIIDALVNVCVKAKEEGMNLAWKCAREIASREDEMCEIFHDIAPAEIFNKYSVSEVIAKFKDYKRRQLKNEVKVGDEVIVDGCKGVIIRPVYHIGEDREPFVQVWYGTHMSSNSLNNVTITGRHFPQIVEVLEQIKEREK